MTRTAREVVELYNLVVWNKRDFALAEELMGETVIRHDVGEATTLTHEQAVAAHRGPLGDVRHDPLRSEPRGRRRRRRTRGDRLPVADDAEGRHQDDVGSMEIFRVVDGRITEVWNCGYKQGVWQ